AQRAGILYYDGEGQSSAASQASGVGGGGRRDPQAGLQVSAVQQEDALLFERPTEEASTSVPALAPTPAPEHTQTITETLATALAPADGPTASFDGRLANPNSYQPSTGSMLSSPVAPRKEEAPPTPSDPTPSKKQPGGGGGGTAPVGNSILEGKAGVGARFRVGAQDGTALTNTFTHLLG
ncbi:unnamed protein product, partial [Discosporangium mesarthrocarpum]